MAYMDVPPAAVAQRPHRRPASWDELRRLLFRRPDRCPAQRRLPRRRARSDRLRPLLEADHSVQLQRHGGQHPQAPPVARHHPRRHRGPLHGRDAGRTLRRHQPDITERVVLYDPIGLTDIRYDRPWRTQPTKPIKRPWLRHHDQLYQAFYTTIRRYFPAGNMEARIREISPHPVCAHAERRLAAPRHGPVDLPADHVSRSGRLRLGPHQNEGAGHRR